MAEYDPDSDSEMEKTVKDDELLKDANPKPTENIAQEVSGKKDETAELQAELKKAKDAYLYLAAEFDNYRKQMIKERSHLAKYGAESVLYQVVGVLDNFERALQTEITEKNWETFKQGISLIADELKKVITQAGVSEIPSENCVFDPQIHEALTSEESDTVPPGNVSRVFRKAYKLHDRVLRTGQVVVARESSSRSDVPSKELDSDKKEQKDEES